MAEFSKQYCDLYDPDMPYDFDLDEIFTNLPEDHYDTSFICEGFGILGVSRINNEMYVLVSDDSEEKTNWILYDVFLENFKNASI